MSEQIIGRLDDMGKRVDDLEKNIADLVQQVDSKGRLFEPEEIALDVSTHLTPSASTLKCTVILSDINLPVTCFVCSEVTTRLGQSFLKYNNIFIFLKSLHMNMYLVQNIIKKHYLTSLDLNVLIIPTPIS